jgi:hypothetical protein
MAWARLSAQLWRRSYADRMRILTDAGVVGDWYAADQHWLDVMVQDIEAGRLERVNAYAQICAQAVAQLDPDAVDNPLPEHLRSDGPPIGWPVGMPYKPPRRSVDQQAMQTAELEPLQLGAAPTSQLAAYGRATTLALDSDATAALAPLEERLAAEPLTARPPPPPAATPASPDDSGATQITAPRPDDG